MSLGTGAKTWVEINANAFKKNVHALRSILEPNASFQAVVKANAYGHDTDTIVRLATTEGIQKFGVDSIDEAMIVKQRSPESDIYILGFTVPERFSDVVQNDFIQTVYRMDMLELLAEEAIRQQRIVRVNIKFETGTNRQGVNIENIEPFLIILRKNERFIKLHGISSHFSESENTDNPEYTIKQNNAFVHVLEYIYKKRFEPTAQHIACSAAAILYPETHFTMTRFGISLYGLWSSEIMKRKIKLSKRSIDLTPVLSWKTRIAQIKEVSAGSSIGYSRGFVTNRPIRIAVLPIGYYDGLRRTYAHNGEVLIRGQRCEIVGNICMNMCMVNVSLLPQLGVGDTVTILGKNGMHQITAEDMAKKMNTINYEVITGINSRLPRVVV